MAALRRLGAADATLIMRHRNAMFAVSGLPAAAVSAASAPYRAWLDDALAAGTYLAWGAEVKRDLVGSVGLWLLSWPPHPRHPTTALRGYITNMWVEPSHRRRGIGRALLDAATDEAKARGITFMALHATAEGKALYEALGWREGNEMTCRLT